MQVFDRLHQAVEQNAIDRLIRLLDAGADPNAADTRGDTALHRAAAGGHACAAALLLAHGADWRIRNRAGKAPLAPGAIDIEGLHRIRQAYHRLAVMPYRDSQPESAQAAACVSRMRRDGILKLGGLVTPAMLRKLQADNRRVILRMRVERLLKRNPFVNYDQKAYWLGAHRAYVYNDALVYSDTLVRLCCHPVLVETANHYLGKRAHIKRVYGMHYLPSPHVETHQFGWHHDMEERILKVMILLTDLAGRDQYMSYVPGTHNVMHPYPRFLENKLDHAYYGISPHDPPVVNTLGKAGDMFLFDANGMHRGNRSMGRVRDALFIEYTVDGNKGNIWGSELSAGKLDSLTQGRDHPLAEFKTLPPKWVRVRNQTPRRRPTWAEVLEDPANWIREEDRMADRPEDGGSGGRGITRQTDRYAVSNR